MKNKADVNYRPGKGKHRCGNCTMWRNGRCSAVWGLIEADKVCDLFKLRTNLK